MKGRLILFFCLASIGNLLSCWKCDPGAYKILAVIPLGVASGFLASKKVNMLNSIFSYGSAAYFSIDVLSCCYYFLKSPKTFMNKYKKQPYFKEAVITAVSRSARNISAFCLCRYFACNYFKTNPLNVDGLNINIAQL